MNLLPSPQQPGSSYPPPSPGTPAIDDSNELPLPNADYKGTSLSVQRIKKEYYDFFEPDYVLSAKQVVSPTSGNPLLTVPMPFVEVSNLEKPAPAILPENTKGQQGPPPMQPKPEPNDDIPLHHAPPVKQETVTPEETKAEQDKSFLNPKWKADMKPKDLQAGFQSVWRRVSSLNIQAFPLPAHLSLPQNQDFLNTTVTRDYLSSVFGGSPQSTYPFQKVKPENVRRKGYNNFMCLNLTWNPRAPQRVGFPGLFYESGLGNDGNGDAGAKRVHRVFIRLQQSMWLYVGNYELVKAEPLTREEWLENSDDMKKTWVEKTCQSEWGEDVRTRIALRKRLSREPTRKEFKAASMTSTGRDAAVTPPDVWAAFDSGKERLQAWVMKCVVYEEAFQKEISEGIKAWRRPSKTKTKKGKNSQAFGENEEQAQVKGRKSKRKNGDDRTEGMKKRARRDGSDGVKVE